VGLSLKAKSVYNGACEKGLVAWLMARPVSLLTQLSGEFMFLLVLSLVAFSLWCGAAMKPGLKAALKARLGKAYGPIFGIGSLVLVVAILWAFRNAPRTELYDVPSWGKHANFLLTLLAFLCFGIFAFRGKLRNVLRWPLLIGALFWGAGHLLANGDSATLLLVAGFVGIAFVSYLSQSAGRAFVPTEVRGGHDLMSLLFGVAAFSIFAQIHGAVIGVPVFQLLR
jgi:uncharacterized membrane protein